MGDAGIGRAGISAILGVALAVAGPYALAGVDVTWQRIALLSLLLACVALLVATFVLSLVAEMCARRASSHADRVLLLADVFLMSSAGAMLVVTTFSFVLAIVRLA